MRVLNKWTAADFQHIVGREPEQDDLDRVNCEQAGQPDHKQCGVCAHGQPMFLCSECVARAYLEKN